MTETDEVTREFEHLLDLYGRLESHAQDGVFEGSKVKIFREMKVSGGYYPRLYRMLSDMGCIEQTRKGTSAYPSLITLFHPPELDTYTSTYKRSRKRLTQKTDVAILRQQVETVARRLPQVDIDKYIVSFDTRLSDLEARIAALEALSQGRE